MSIFSKIALYLVLITTFCTSCQSDAQPDIQNVVLLIGDDHSTRALACYGNKIIQTPNIDRLAEDGTVFMNAYANAPICNASRQSLLTGKYPHSTGVTLLSTPFQDETNKTIAEYLRDHGYSTGVIGKTHFNNRGKDKPDHGFSVMIGDKEYKSWLKSQNMPQISDSIRVLTEWRPFVDSARIWLNADVLPTAIHEQFGSAAFDAAKAIEFLQQNKDTAFFLCVGFHEPHAPFHFPLEFAGKYDPAEMPMPKGSSEDDRFVPEIFRDLSEDDKRGIVASYYTSVEYMDQNVGKILDEIDRLGLAENTLVIYLGDQGYLLGDHKRFEKHTMWDPAIKAPLIFRLGSSVKGSERTKALVQFIDVVPTILDIVGLPPLESVQGRSMKYLFGLKNAAGNDYVLAEFPLDDMAMITDGKWKYIYTTGLYDLGQGYATGYGPTGTLHRLYDLQNDPEESSNIADFPGNETILKSLQEHMLNIFRETHPEASKISDTLSLEKQLADFCKPYDKGASRGNR